MFLKKESRLLFIGDSVTDCGRDYTAQPASYSSLGNGYVSLINAALTAIYPEYRIMVINKGVNGNDVLRLNDRWQKDVIELKPDYVSILIGVNDVWRQFDSVFKHREDLVNLEEYRQKYQELIDKTKSQVEQIFIVSPVMFEPNLNDPMRAQVDCYRQVAEELATKNHLLYIDLQRAVDRFLISTSSYVLTQDRVHPNLQGHMLFANTWLNRVDFDWERG